MHCKKGCELDIGDTQGDTKISVSLWMIVKGLLA